MANVQSFPLFRLPILAYENVIDMLHLKQKFNLSAISKKSSLRIKRYNNLKKHDLIILLWCNKYSARVFVYVNRGDKSHIKEINSWNYDFGDHYNVVVDPTVAQITQMASVAPTASLRLKLNETHPVVHTTFIPLAERLNLTLNSVEMSFLGLEPDDEECRYVFENCKHAQTLIYYADTTPEFTLGPDTMGTYSFDFFDFSTARWITVEHLRKCFDGCKYIELSDTKFSAEDMNGFLKHWIEGSKVQNLVLPDNDPVFEVMTDVLAGITAVTHQHVYDRKYGHTANQGYVIKNNDGLEALIHNAEGNFHLTTDFDIVDENFSSEESSDEDEDEDYEGISQHPDD